MPRVLILQHTEWCHWGLMNATSACTTHRHCWELILQLFCGYLQLWLIPSPHCFLLQAPMPCEARELLPEVPVSLRDGGFALASSCEAGFKRKKKKSWHLKSQFYLNSAVFAETILIWYISPLLRVPKSLSGSTYHRRWLMLCLLCLKSECLLIQYCKSRTKDHTYETTRYTARQEFTAKNYHIQMRDGRKKAKCKPSFPKIMCNLKLCQN